MVKQSIKDILKDASKTPQGRMEILSFITDDLFNMVTEKDTMQVVGGKLIHNGYALSQDEKNGIIEQAKDIRSFPLYKILLDELKWAANKKMYFSSTVIEDMMAGKLMLYSIDILEKKIDNLSKLK